MQLILNLEQTMLRDTARGFLANAAPIGYIRDLVDHGNATERVRTLWAQLGETGFTSILVPENEDGAGLGHVEAGIVLAELGRQLAPTPLVQTALGAATVLQFASAELRARWCPRIAAAEVIFALAVDEGPKHAPDAITLNAERDGTRYVLSGEKQFVLFADLADQLVVVGRLADDPRRMALFLMPTNTPGLTIIAERLIDGSRSSNVRLSQVLVPASDVVGIEGDNNVALENMLAVVTLGTAAELIGVAERAFDMTLGYLRERRQFGVPIGSFQALQHRAAHVHAEIVVASAAVFKAQRLLDRDIAEARSAVSVAKAAAALAATLATQEGLQMHGGIGMTHEHNIGLATKRARVLSEMFGDADFHADRLARLNGY